MTNFKINIFNSCLQCFCGILFSVLMLTTIVLLGITLYNLAQDQSPDGEFSEKSFLQSFYKTLKLFGIDISK